MNTEVLPYGFNIISVGNTSKLAGLLIYTYTVISLSVGFSRNVSYSSTFPNSVFKVGTRII